MDAVGQFEGSYGRSDQRSAERGRVSVAFFITARDADRNTIPVLLWNALHRRPAIDELRCCQPQPVDARSVRHCERRFAHADSALTLDLAGAQDAAAARLSHRQMQQQARQRQCVLCIDPVHAPSAIALKARFARDRRLTAAV